MSLGEFLKIHKKLQNEKALHFYGTCTSFTPLLVFGLKDFPLSATTPTTGFNECTTSLEHLKNIHQKPDLMSTQQT